MKNPLQDFDRRAIAATLRFVNLPGVASDAAVERCFRAVVDFDETRPRPSGHANEVTASFRDESADVHVIVREWLGRIADTRSPAANAERARAAVAKAVDHELEQHVSARLTLAPGRRLEYDYEIQSVKAACALGVALILDEDRGLASRLSRCKWCQHITLDLAGRRGRPRTFCNDEHARLYDARDSKDRQQEFRNKQAKKRKARKA